MLRFFCSLKSIKSFCSLSKKRRKTLSKKLNHNFKSSEDERRKAQTRGKHWATSDENIQHYTYKLSLFHIKNSFYILFFFKFTCFLRELKNDLKLKVDCSVKEPQSWHVQLIHSPNKALLMLSLKYPKWPNFYSCCITWYDVVYTKSNFYSSMKN